MVKKWMPDRGDIVWLSFDPQAGHEQKGKRPALTLSPQEYNKKTGLGVFCPITSKIKNYPFEVFVSNDKIKGVVLADQVKSLDWTKRNAQFIAKAAKAETNDVLQKLITLISGDPNE